MAEVMTSSEAARAYQAIPAIQYEYEQWNHEIEVLLKDLDFLQVCGNLLTIAKKKKKRARGQEWTCSAPSHTLRRMSTKLVFVFRQQTMTIKGYCEASRPHEELGYDLPIV